MKEMEIKLEPTEFIDVSQIKVEQDCDTGPSFDPLGFVNETKIKTEIGELIQNDGPEDSLSSMSSIPNSPDSTCRVVILEQPVSKVRFRYLSELQGTPHGPLLGEHSSKSKKTFPKVKLLGYDGKDEAKVRCWLVDKMTGSQIKNNYLDSHVRPHCHDLVVRKIRNYVCKQEIAPEPHQASLSRDNDFTATFENMVVLHSVQRETEIKYHQKEQKWLNRIHADEMMSSTSDTDFDKTKIKKVLRSINKNEVYLYFEAYIVYRDAIQVLCSTLSNPIKNMKDPSSGDLKICKMVPSSGSCDGDQEVVLFVEKVPADVKVKMVQIANNIKLWENIVTPDYVHRNVALTFRTPKFYMDIEEKVEVEVTLYRETDQGCSNIHKYTYLPSEDRINCNKKRVRYEDTVLSVVNSREDLEGLLKQTIFNDEPIICENWSASSIEYALNGGIVVGEELLIDSDGLNGPSGVVVRPLESRECTSGGITSPTNNNNKIPLEQLMRNILLSGRYKDINCLQEAVMLDKIDVLKSLLDFITGYTIPTAIDRNQSYKLKAAILKIRNHRHHTLLHTAVVHDRTDMIHPLLDFGYDPKLTDRNGNTAFHAAASRPGAALRSLISYYQKSGVDGEGVRQKTAHHHGFDKADMCPPKILKEMLSSTNVDGWNVVHVAAKCGVAGNVEMMVANKLVDVDAKTSNGGDTAMHIACRYQRLPIATILIQNGAKIGEVNLADETPLQISVFKNDHQMVALLVANRCCQLVVNPSGDDDNDFDGDEAAGPVEVVEGHVYADSSSYGLPTSDKALMSVTHLAQDMMMLNILAGETKSVDLIEEKKVDKRSTGPLLSPRQSEALSQILSENNLWERFASKLHKKPLDGLFKGFPHPEKVLINFINHNRYEVLGEGDHVTILADIFSSMNLSEARKIVTGAI